jgi:hypothetical protein
MQRNEFLHRIEEPKCSTIVRQQSARDRECSARSWSTVTLHNIEANIIPKISYGMLPCHVVGKSPYY